MTLTSSQNRATLGLRNGPFDSFRLRATAWRHRIANGLFARNPVSPSALEASLARGVIADFRATRYIHFGDLMFFFPLLLALAARAPVTCLATGEHYQFLKFLLGDEPLIQVTDTLAGGADAPRLVITSPYSIGLDPHAWAGDHLYGVGLADEPVAERYPEYLANAFFRLTGLPYEGPQANRDRILGWCARVREKAIQHDTDACLALDAPVLWFAPYMGSGRFRDLFGCHKRAVIAHACAKAQSHGQSLLLAGGKNDPLITLERPPLIDMRGRAITEMMRLAASPQVREGVGFDGFWMHFFDILGKPFEVRFRGRFTRAARDLHYQSVNVSFNYSTERRYF